VSPPCRVVLASVLCVHNGGNADLGPRAKAQGVTLPGVRQRSLIGPLKNSMAFDHAARNLYTVDPMAFSGCRWAVTQAPPTTGRRRMALTAALTVTALDGGVALVFSDHSDEISRPG
jgi:hypothetical protein